MNLRSFYAVRRAVSSITTQTTLLTRNNHLSQPCLHINGTLRWFSEYTGVEDEAFQAPAKTKRKPPTKAPAFVPRTKIPINEKIHLKLKEHPPVATEKDSLEFVSVLNNNQNRAGIFLKQDAIDTGILEMKDNYHETFKSYKDAVAFAELFSQHNTKINISPRSIDPQIKILGKMRRVPAAYSEDLEEHKQYRTELQIQEYHDENSKMELIPTYYALLRKDLSSAIFTSKREFFEYVKKIGFENCVHIGFSVHRSDIYAHFYKLVNKLKKKYGLQSQKHKKPTEKEITNIPIRVYVFNDSVTGKPYIHIEGEFEVWKFEMPEGHEPESIHELYFLGLYYASKIALDTLEYYQNKFPGFNPDVISIQLQKMYFISHVFEDLTSLPSFRRVYRINDQEAPVLLKHLDKLFETFDTLRKFSIEKYKYKIEHKEKFKTFQGLRIEPVDTKFFNRFQDLKKIQMEPEELIQPLIDKLTYKGVFSFNDQQAFKSSQFSSKKVIFDEGFKDSIQDLDGMGKYYITSLHGLNNALLETLSEIQQFLKGEIGFIPIYKYAFTKRLYEDYPMTEMKPEILKPFEKETLKHYLMVLLFQYCNSDLLPTHKPSMIKYHESQDQWDKRAGIDFSSNRLNRL